MSTINFECNNCGNLFPNFSREDALEHARDHCSGPMNRGELSRIILSKQNRIDKLEAALIAKKLHDAIEDLS